MLVNGYKEMKPFLPAINMKGEPTVFDDALDVAQSILVEQIIGEDLEDLLEARNASDARLLKLCQRVIAVEAFLVSVPEMDLVLTDAGFGVISNQDVAPASRERVANMTAGLQAKLDEAKDRLVTYLLRADTYSRDWRGTEQFARLSDGLILTFADFKELAVYNSVTAPVYPKTWSDFQRLGASLNTALMSDAACYISPEFAEELLEDVRDGETLLPSVKKVLRMVEIGIAAIAMGDVETGRMKIVETIPYMKANPDDFPTYINSRAAEDMTLEHSDTPIFSLF